MWTHWYHSGDAAVRRKSGVVGPLLLPRGSQRLKLRSPGTLTPRSLLAGTHTEVYGLGPATPVSRLSSSEVDTSNPSTSETHAQTHSHPRARLSPTGVPFREDRLET